MSLFKFFKQLPVFVIEHIADVNLPLPPLSLPCPRDLGASSISNVSRGKLSGRIKYLMLLPRILKVSSWTGSLFLMVILTDLRCVFMLTSTPETNTKDQLSR